MRKILRLMVVLLIISPFSSFAQREIVFDAELKMTQLNDYVWVVTHCFPWESNSLVVQASDKEVVLIDTPYTNEATETVLKYIQEKLKPKRITAIITGFHVDNLGGTGSLLKHGIPVDGADRTCKLIDEKSAQTQQQLLTWLKAPEQEKYRQAYTSMKFEKPDRVFPIKKGLFLKKGKLSFEVYFPGESHSPDNLAVYIKELDLLFGGCMVKSLESRNLGFTGDANMNEWPVSIQKIRAKYPHAKLVIPHHGQWGDAALLRHTFDLLNAR
jgi:glyoxylase-like metal-dependent hydrolase (beta-lactamase superfamily II)